MHPVRMMIAILAQTRDVIIEDVAIAGRHLVVTRYPPQLVDHSIELRFIVDAVRHRYDIGLRHQATLQTARAADRPAPGQTSLHANSRLGNKRRDRDDIHPNPAQRPDSARTKRSVNQR